MIIGWRENGRAKTRDNRRALLMFIESRMAYNFYIALDAFMGVISDWAEVERSAMHALDVGLAVKGVS